MIIRKLIVDNFRQIYGRHEISFALPGDRNVTVILGQNNSGKTTLLNVFVWCLYKQIVAENASEIVSHKAAQVIEIGDKVAVEVSLMFQDGLRSYTVKRRATFRKLDGGTLEEAVPSDFRVDVMEQNGETSSAPDPGQVVQQLLPEGLRRFFFFRGEDMENMALQSSGPQLTKGVEEFLNLTLLDRAITKHLKPVARDFEAELGKIAVGAMKQITESLAQADEELRDAQNRLEIQENNVLELKKTRERIEQDMNEVGEVRPLIEEKGRLQTRKEESERKEESFRSLLARTLSENGFLWRADSILALPLKLADEAVRRGDIPAKIKPMFIEDLIARGNCICGRELDDDARVTLLKWRGGDGLASFEAEINLLRNATQVLLSRRERLKQDLDLNRTAWATTKAEIRRATEQISNLDSQLQGKDFGIEYVRGLQNNLKKVNDDLIERSAGIARAKDDVERIVRNQDALRKDLRLQTKDDKAAEVIQRRYDATINVINALSKMREGWLAIVQEYLDGQLRANWEKVAQLDRHVEFTNDFILSMKERGPDGNWTTSAPGSANLRVLALCFVSALIKLAYEIGGDVRQKGDQSRRQEVFQGGEYPLVMDAPFATMDKHFKRTVPMGLRSVVPQVVILSNYDQWAGAVEEALHPAVGAAYILELHIPGSEDAGSSIAWNGHHIDYVVAEPGAPTDWTVIREVSR